MTTKAEFTKEQLIEHIKDRIEHRNGLVEAQGIERGFCEYLRKEIATDEIALSVLTAEPMGWMDELTENPAVLVAIPQRLIPEGKNDG